MLTTILPCLILALAPGDVRTVLPSMTVTAPGKLNWYCKDPLIAVTKPTPAVVLRVNPEQVLGVVEVKLRDGTDRIGWLEPTDPKEPLSTTALTVTAAKRADPSPRVAGNEVKPYVQPYRKRKYRRQDHAAIDMAMQEMYMMLNGTGGGGWSGGGGGGGGTVHVRGYTRANGTYVQPYTRSAPRR